MVYTIQRTALKLAVGMIMMLIGGCNATMEGLQNDVAAMRGRMSNAPPTSSETQTQDTEQNAEQIPGQKTNSTAASWTTSLQAPRYEVDMVRETQLKLQMLGYDIGKLDGRYGGKTEAAIQDFQLDNDLSIDGVPSISLLRLIDAKL